MLKKAPIRGINIIANAHKYLDLILIFVIN